MTVSTRLALALLPLAGYFFALGVLNSGRRPRVISGAADFALLSLGLGGLLAFGPVGGACVRWIFPRETLAAWMAVGAFVGLVAMFGVTRTRARLLVYHASGDDLRRAIGRAMARVAGVATPTLHGFEDVARGRGIRVEVGRVLGSASIEAYGTHPESFAETLMPALREELSGEPATSSRWSTFWFGLACLTTMIVLILVLVRTTAASAVPARLTRPDRVTRQLPGGHAHGFGLASPEPPASSRPGRAEGRGR